MESAGRFIPPPRVGSSVVGPAYGPISGSCMRLMPPFANRRLISCQTAPVPAPGASPWWQPLVAVARAPTGPSATHERLVKGNLVDR
jgi:hypothetical protein